MKRSSAVRCGWMRGSGAAILAAGLLLAVGAAPAVADEGGTGFDPTDERGGLALMNAVLGTDWEFALEDHPDYVEDFGVQDCVDCHPPEGVGYVFDDAPGCLTCHGPEFCEAPGSELLPVCQGGDDEPLTVVRSPGTMDMNGALGVVWLDPAEEHQDYVEEFGIDDCIDCHEPEVGGKPSFMLFGQLFTDTFMGQGCLSCHGPKYCGAPGTEGLAICADDETDDHEDDHEDDD